MALPTRSPTTCAWQQPLAITLTALIGVQGVDFIGQPAAPNQHAGNVTSTGTIEAVSRWLDQKQKTVCPSPGADPTRRKNASENSNRFRD